MTPPLRPVVTVTRRLPAPVETALAERFDCRLNATDVALGGDGLRRALAESDAVLCTVSDVLDAAVLGRRPGARPPAGQFRRRPRAHRPARAARALGIAVTNTPGVLTDDTADLAIALMLMAARGLGSGERELRSGAWAGWHPMHHLGTRLSGKTLGIIGMGRIGRAVARRAVHGFGMRLVYAQPDATLGGGKPRCSTRCRSSWTRSSRNRTWCRCTCTANEGTRHLVDARRLALMPRHGILINTTRGFVVDEAALTEALAARGDRGGGAGRV